MNRYSPYHDHDEYYTGMTIDDRGNWVHISAANAVVKERDAAIEALRQVWAETHRNPGGCAKGENATHPFTAATIELVRVALGEERP